MKKRFTEEQIIDFLREAEACTPVAERSLTPNLIFASKRLSCTNQPKSEFPQIPSRFIPHAPSSVCPVA